MTVYIPLWLIQAVVYLGLVIVGFGLLLFAIELADKVFTYGLRLSKAKEAYFRFLFTGRGPLKELDKVYQEIEDIRKDVRELKLWKWDMIMRQSAEEAERRKS